MSSTAPSARDIFWEALVIESDDQRQAYIEQACKGNSELLSRVLQLLHAHDAIGGRSVLKPPAVLAEATAVDVHKADSSGGQIGVYKLREQIGEGGFGEVYVAEQEHPVSRKVALKIIKPGMGTKDVIARFEAERQALALMNHPNVAKVLDAGSTESGRPYFVMELVYGVPLNQFCDEQRLSNRARLRLFIDVCRAVQHAHQKGIIHRDLKPSNILVTMHDDKPVPKVIDFGVAKALSQKLTDKTVYTSYGQMVGTPLYMSPEQAQMSGLDVDTRSDVYSLGVLLYELLTGTTPFDRETLKKAGFDELRRIIREDDPPCPSARVSTLNAQMLSTASDRRGVDQRRLSQSLRGELDWIVMKALEKDRSRRYQSASQFAEDIENYLHDAPVEACPPSLPYKWRKFARRNRVVLTSAALVALALLLGTFASAWQAVRASDALAQADQHRTAAVATAKRARASERVAKNERNSAVAAREELRRVLYASELNLVQSAWETGNYRRVTQLLEGTRPKEGEGDLRGFEWHYWNRRLNASLETHVTDMPQIGNRRLLEDTLSPHGKKLAVQYYDQQKISVAIWDVVTLREVCSFELSPGTIRSPRTPMAFSPDGTRLAIAGPDDGRLRIWDTQTGEQLFQREGEIKVYLAGFSGDGNRLVYTFQASEEAEGALSQWGYRVWDLRTDRIVFSHRYEADLIAGIMFVSPDGRQIGFRTRKKDERGAHLQIWDAETAEVLKDRGFDGRLDSAELSDDGSRLVLRDRSAPDRLMLLDTQTLKTVCTFRVDENQSRPNVAFSPDGRLLAVAADTRKVLIWNVANLANDTAAETAEHMSPMLTLHVPRSTVELRFSADSKQLHSCIYGGVWTWKMPELVRPRETRSWSHGAVIGGSFNREGTRAVLKAEPGDFNQWALILAWDVKADRELWRYKDPRDDRAFASFINPVLGPDGRFVVVPSGKRRTSRAGSSTVFHDELLVLDGDTGKKLRSIRPEGASNIDNMAFTPEGGRVAAFVTRRPEGQPASYHVVLWDVATGGEVFAVAVDDEDPNLCGFSSDGKELLVALRGSGGILVLDAETGASRRVIAPDGTALNRFGSWSLSPDGKTLAALGLQHHPNDIAVAFFDAASGKAGLRIPVDTEFPPVAMSWSSDGRRLALVSAQGTSTDVSIWDTQTGRVLLTLNRMGLANRNRRALCFSLDGHRLLHITGDNRVEPGAWDNPSTHPIRIWTAAPLAGG